jgi:hypothetical protein
MDHDAITCGGKIRHASRRLAVEALKNQYRHLDRDGRDRPTLSVYGCPHCGGHHVGTVDVRRRRAERAGGRRMAVRDRHYEDAA